MSDRIYEFPTLPISKQLFHVPGSAIEGGFTAGGARILSPEPGGRSMLELQLSMQISEWDYPSVSWLMSKTNGQIFRVRLAPTPQVLSVRGKGVPWDNNGPWNNLQNWQGDLIAEYVENASEGTTKVRIGMAGLGEVLRVGHVIGHMNNCYMVDEISYSNGTADVTVTPPLRKYVSIGDVVYFRPWFLGTIINGSEIRATYDAENVGMIQPGMMQFSEVMI